MARLMTMYEALRKSTWQPPHSIIMSKLTPELRVQLARKTACELWEIMIFWKLSEKRWRHLKLVRASEQTVLQVSLIIINTNKMKHANKIVKEMPVLLQQIYLSRMEKMSEKSNVYCGHLHYSASCDIVRSLCISV